MSLRRSRLKAVTNLPVRRKTLPLQGNANEAVLTDNLTSEKVYSSDLKANDTTSPEVVQENNIAINNASDTPFKNSEPDINSSSTGDFQNPENSVNELNLSKNNECNTPEVIESLKESRSTINCRADNNNGPVFKSNKRFKPNLVSSTLREKVQVQTPEKSLENETIDVDNCMSITNNTNISYSYNGNSNDIIREGFKCYSVLTSDNVTLGPLSEYTISPCVNAFNDTTLSEVGTPQECKEVQLYTEVEASELFINNEIGNCETVIESETLEPVLTDLTCRNNQEEVQINYTNVNSSFVEVENPENLVTKSVPKNGIFNNKINNSGDDGNYRNTISQRQDLDISQYAISLNACPNLHPFKKRRSTVRSKRTKCNDYTKKLADAKKEFQKRFENSKPDRSALKMIDLIFYNPGTNPMESKVKLEKTDTHGFTQVSEEIQDSLAEEKVDEPEALDSNSRSNASDSGETESVNKMPVPQVKIGLDGEIILDEKSLIIETTDAKKGREGLQNSTPVFEDRECKVSYYRGRCKKPRDWSDFETKRFYKALNTIGPDFTLMQKFFPTRSRLELKNKFKREERLNRSLIDKALNNPSEFDMTQLEGDLAIEKEAEEEIKVGRKKRRKKPKIRKASLLSREMIDSEESESDSGESKVNCSNSKRLSEDEKNKKEKEFEFVFQKLLMKESQMSCNTLPEIPSSPNTFEYSNPGVT